MEKIHVSILSDILLDGHPEIINGNTRNDGQTVKLKTYRDEDDGQMYLVTTILHNDDILSIEKVESNYDK